mmetsp:Transcript_5567/g.14818  ORF Transcript_5567/g.14818 Transcript_5567/m.14818 type:complete len:263 (+) Transcript_5567:312-1100(+)
MGLSRATPLPVCHCSCGNGSTSSPASTSMEGAEVVREAWSFPSSSSPTMTSSSSRQEKSPECSQSGWSLGIEPFSNSSTGAVGESALRSPQRTTRGNSDAPSGRCLSRISCISCSKQITCNARMWRAFGWKKRCVFATTMTSPVTVCLMAEIWKMVVMCGSTPVRKTGHFAMTSRRIGRHAGELLKSLRKRNSFSSRSSKESLRTINTQPSDALLAFNDIRRWYFAPNIGIRNFQNVEKLTSCKATKSPSRRSSSRPTKGWR